MDAPKQAVARTQFAVCMHFDSASGMLYEQGPRLDNRRKYTVETQAWWDARLRLLQRLVVPSLLRQTHKADVWAFIDPRDVERAKDALQWLEGQGVRVSLVGPGLLRAYYSHRPIGHLVVVHMDSDDMYGPEAIATLARQQWRDGQVYWYRQGYIFGLDNRRLCEFDTGPEGPPPFHAMAYTRDSLADEDAWDHYRDTWGLAVPHHKLPGVRRKAVLDGRHFIVTVHAHNTTTGWDNKYTQRNTGRELTDHAERHAVVEAFGLTAWED